MNPTTKATFELLNISSKKTGRAAILGAGPTGLATAWRLAKYGWEVEIFEKMNELGGHGATEKINGYDLDQGPHKLYPQVECAEPLIRHFIPPKDLLEIPKKSQIYLKGKYIPFPFGLGDLFKGLGLGTGVRCGVGYMLGKIEKSLKKSRTYTDFVIGQYGRYSNNLIFRPVAEKIWGNPDFLDIQLAKTRIVAPNLLELVKGLLFGVKNKPSLSADVFYYPRKGMRQLWENIGDEIKKLKGVIHRETVPTAITYKQNQEGFTLSYQNKTDREEKEKNFDIVISTLPIHSFYPLLKPQAPDEIQECAKALQFASLRILYIVVQRLRLLSSNWVFFPESRYHFSRISEQKGFSEEMIPKDQTVLTVEIPVAREEMAKKDKETLLKETLEQLEEVHILSKKDVILKTFETYHEKIYPIYDQKYHHNLERFLAFSDQIQGLYLNGRLGLFCYNNMDHSLEMGLSLADHITAQKSIEEWKITRNTFYDYKIVD